LCSTIENVLKRLVADDPALPQGSPFTRFTVKCRTLGTNTYIGIGGTSQSFRFTAAGQAMTYISPVVGGNMIPLDIFNMYVIGDAAGGLGILEISGIRVYEAQ
jgi:hypothetical protein